MTWLRLALAEARSQDRASSLVARQADLVHGAEDYLERSWTEDTSVGSICEALGVRPRTLQEAFHAVVGVGPCRYGRMLRLHAARRELNKAAAFGHSVTDVGLSNGFAHLGRFSKYYRDFFGERPSETLGRGAARAAVAAFG